MTTFFDSYNLTSLPVSSFSTLASGAEVVHAYFEDRLRDTSMTQPTTLSTRLANLMQIRGTLLGADAAADECDHQIMPHEVEAAIQSVQISGDILNAYQRIHHILLWCQENGYPISKGILSKDCRDQGQKFSELLRARQTDFVVSPATAVTKLASSIPNLPREIGCPLESERELILETLTEQYKNHGLKHAYDQSTRYVPQPTYARIVPYVPTDLSELSAVSYLRYRTYQAVFHELKSGIGLTLLNNLSLPSADTLKWSLDEARACNIGAEACLASRRVVNMQSTKERSAVELECKATGDLVLKFANELRRLIIDNGSPYSGLQDDQCQAKMVGRLAYTRSNLEALRKLTPHGFIVTREAVRDTVSQLLAPLPLDPQQRPYQIFSKVLQLMCPTVS